MRFKDTELIIYRSEDGTIKIDVRMEDETVWLSQAQMVELFQTTKQNISLHINNGRHVNDSKASLLLWESIYFDR